MKQLGRLAMCMMALLWAITAAYQPPASADEDNQLLIPTTDNQQVPTSLRISTVGKRSDVPVLAQAPNGRLLAVFNQWVDNDPLDSDPYFTISTNGGQSWSAPQAIATSPGTKSSVTATYDRNSVAHVAWIDELGTFPNIQTRIFYVNNQSGNWSTPQTLLNTTGPTPVKLVSILHSAANRIDVVWDREDGSSHKYTRLTWNGSAWVANPYNSSGPLDQYAFPKITADNNGHLHSVWQEPSSFNTYYAFFNAAGNSWSTPLQISNGLVANKTIQSDITFHNGRLYAAMTYKVDPNQEFSNQAVYIRTCNLTSATACTNASNWTAIQNATGQFMGVNGSDPKDLVPNFFSLRSGGSRQGMIFLHFHGVAGLSPNEISWRVDSCSNWAAQGLYQLTSPTGTPSLRGINPVGQAQIIGPRIVVHTVYEEVSTAPNPSREIRYVQSTTNCGQIFLPFISR